MGGCASRRRCSHRDPKDGETHGEVTAEKHCLGHSSEDMGVNSLTASTEMKKKEHTNRHSDVIGEQEENPKMVVSDASSCNNPSSLRQQNNDASTKADPQDSTYEAYPSANDSPLPSCGGSDQSESAGAHQKNPSPALSTQSSRLHDPQRRRLSVSTVQLRTETVSPVSRDAAVQLGKNQETPRSTRSQLEPQHTNVPSQHPRLRDPALALINTSTGTVRDVTLPMVFQLLPPNAASLLIFGTPSQGVQRGFDNKQLEILGSLASPSYNIAEHGIGFACKKGLKPESPNQDDFFILKVDDWSLYGVFDGHGPFGHQVSSFIHRVLPYLIVGDPNFDADPVFVLRHCFRKAHNLLEAMCEMAGEEMDCSLSGTTSTVVLHRNGKFYVAHVGDSRAVLSSKNGNRFKAVNLTLDHKPTCEEERQRLEASGGEVRRLEGDIPYRVFVKNRLYPGLAMSRAIGDTVGAQIGIIPDPDVRVVELSEADQFVIISTDGVWEFISSQEAVDFVCQKTRAEVQKAAEFLAYESWRRWVEEEENVVDDVTCVIVWIGT